MFGEIRSAMNGGDVVALPDGWRENETLRGYVEAYTQRNEWSVKGDVLEDDTLSVMCGGLIMKTLSGDELERARQVAVWPVRLHAVVTYFEPCLPEDMRPRFMLDLRRQRLMGCHVRFKTWNAAIVDTRWAARSAVTLVTPRLESDAANGAAWSAETEKPRHAVWQASRSRGHLMMDGSSFDHAHSEYERHKETVATNIIRLVRGEDPAEIMSWEVTK